MNSEETHIEDKAAEEKTYTLEDLDFLLELMEKKRFRLLKSILSDWNEADIAEFLEEVSDQLGGD